MRDLPEITDFAENILLEISICYIRRHFYFSTLVLIKLNIFDKTNIFE